DYYCQSADGSFNVLF
nr:immunoglobulin light chain junction region [Macaca mulatta]MOW27372.1 immunoglobulin light chain junction region [Macaca mulatta]MOW27511.1 immunoglobulin light chain junction region [Macaca mulatta]MOW27600.1 immunoglobulin light chain junction region [Macaca mulatta]MOW27889.1 immunoglobulin light chain junction region [Macaca mulatta]